MTRNDALYVALRIGSWLVPRLPLRLVYAIAALCGHAAYYLFPGPRAAVLANLSRALQRPPNDRRLRRVARRAFANDARNWVDTLRIAEVGAGEIAARLEVDGWHHVETALAEGKGVVMVGMHLGNFDLVGHALLFRGPGLTVPVERMEPERLFRFLVDVRRSKGINVVPFDRAGREMLAALRAGKIVGIIGDRNVGGSRGVRAEFFGKEAVFPRAPVSLARHAGSPVLVGVAVRLPSERFRGYITPVSMQRSGQAEADERENVRHIARVMEDFIRRFPDQWLMFAPVWEDGARENSTATMNQPNEAAIQR